MWVIELSFTGAPERLAARPAHRELMAGLHAAGTVRMAGPYADDSGALIVLDVPDRAAADAIVAADPYYRTAGVIVAGIREWNPIFG